jgi:hypothetical protein
VTRIVRGFPPNISEIRARLNPGPRTVYAYDDTIYSPSGMDLPLDLIRHEETHFAQQKLAGGADAWWQRYLDDPQFRLEQEIEAYRAQYATIAGLPRQQRRRLLQHICKTLSSGLYGRRVTAEQARALIAGGAA